MCFYKAKLRLNLITTTLLMVQSQDWHGYRLLTVRTNDLEVGARTVTSAAPVLGTGLFCNLASFCTSRIDVGQIHTCIIAHESAARGTNVEVKTGMIVLLAEQAGAQLNLGH